MEASSASVEENQLLEEDKKDLAMTREMCTIQKIADSGIARIITTRFGHHLNAVSAPGIIICCVALLQLKSGTIIQLYQQFVFLLLRKRDTVPFT